MKLTQQSVEQKQYFNQLMEKIDDVHKNLLEDILEGISEENAALLEEIYQTLEEQKLNVNKANQFLKVVQEKLPANLENSQKIKKQLNSMDLTTSSKLKLAIPIIPTILIYEMDLGSEWTDAIPKVWKNIVSRFKK